MATIIYLDMTKQRASEINTAIAQIRDGLAVLEKYDGMRAEARAVDEATVNSIFGCTDGNTFSDLWAQVLAAFHDSQDTSMGKLRDLLSAVVSQ